MKLEITSEIAKHKVNNNYECLLVHFEESDKHFFKEKMNWMPKDKEVFDIFQLLYQISPTFKDKVNEYMLK